MSRRRNRPPTPKIITEEEEAPRIELAVEAEADIFVAREIMKNMDKQNMTFGEAKPMIKQVFEMI